MKAGDRSAWPTVIPDFSVPGGPELVSDAIGAGRTRNDAGIRTIHTRMPRVICAVRQSETESSHAASGDIVIGAMPTPTETRDIASPRWRSNHALAPEIMGAKNVPADNPISTP